VYVHGHLEGCKYIYHKETRDRSQGKS